MFHFYSEFFWIDWQKRVPMFDFYERMRIKFTLRFHKLQLVTTADRSKDTCEL